MKINVGPPGTGVPQLFGKLLTANGIDPKRLSLTEMENTLATVALLAVKIDRMWLVMVALGALLLPLSRVVPPLYVWKVRSRIYRWYGQLRSVEQAVEEASGAGKRAICDYQLKRLGEIEQRVNQLTIPLSFAEELYDLRSHINFVRKRILWLQQSAEITAVD